MEKEKTSVFKFSEAQRQKFKFLSEQFNQVYEKNESMSETLLKQMTNYLLEIYILREEVITRCLNLAKKGELDP